MRERGNAVFTKKINTANEKEIVFDNLNNYISGSYVAEFIIKDQRSRLIVSGNQYIDLSHETFIMISFYVVVFFF